MPGNVKQRRVGRFIAGRLGSIIQIPPRNPGSILPHQRGTVRTPLNQRQSVIRHCGEIDLRDLLDNQSISVASKFVVIGKTTIAEHNNRQLVRIPHGCEAAVISKTHCLSRYLKTFRRIVFAISRCRPNVLELDRVNIDFEGNVSAIRRNGKWSVIRKLKNAAIRVDLIACAIFRHDVQKAHERIKLRFRFIRRNRLCRVHPPPAST